MNKKSVDIAINNFQWVIESGYVRHPQVSTEANLS